MRTVILALVAAALLVYPAAAHDKPVTGPNNGQMVHLEDAHYELVAKDSELTLYVSDEDQKPRTGLTGAKATATVLAGGKTTTVALSPATADTFKGSGSFVSAKGMRVVVSVQEVGRKPAQIRFTPLH